MAQEYMTWEGPGTYSLNEPSPAPLADYEVFVYCENPYQLGCAVTEYVSNYGGTPMVQRVEVEHGRCYC